MSMLVCFFFFKQKTAYEMRISDWSSDVCSSDLDQDPAHQHLVARERAGLVGTDDRGRAERFDGRETTDDGVACSHPLDADSKRDRDHRRQSLDRKSVV